MDLKEGQIYMSPKGEVLEIGLVFRSENEPGDLEAPSIWATYHRYPEGETREGEQVIIPTNLCERLLEDWSLQTVDESYDADVLEFHATPPE